MFDPKPGDKGKRIVYAADRPHLTQPGVIVDWNNDHVIVSFDKKPKPLHRCLRSSLTEEKKEGAS